MLTIDWTKEGGWQDPQIKPFADFSVHPGAKVLHYAQELFEGMKAYRGVDGKIRLFRPMHNMARMNLTASSWSSALGSWWWSIRSGCPTTPPLPSTSGPP